MSEYIDREKLLSDIEHYHVSDGVFQHWVEVQPAADVAPVRHGRWNKTLERKFIQTNRWAEKYQKEDLGYGGRIIENLQCSACRKVTMVDNSIFYKYCPHCGAKMDEEDG